MTYKVLINASNLHVGGGVQVAASFIDELSRMDGRLTGYELHVYASSAVNDNLVLDVNALGAIRKYCVVDVEGLEAMKPNVGANFQGFDLVFTVFGPSYLMRSLPNHIVGFAQPWIINPDNEISRRLGWRSRLSLRLKFSLQRQFFKRATGFIVELDHVKNGLLRAGIGNADRIQVVRNCLSSVYTMPELWRSVDVPITQADFKLGFVGRNYLHKNTGIFPAVREALQRVHGLEVNFYVTFTDEEWAECTEAFRAAVINVGALSVAQCPSFYQAMDGVIFPSLLECFSATPLEAMAMERPLFASDRPFNRDVCFEHAHYFDPLDPDNAAGVIEKFIRIKAPHQIALQQARAHALSFSNAKERAQHYLNILFESAARGKV